jgi:hypothetical protein
VGTDGIIADGLGFPTILHYNGTSWSIAPSPVLTYFSAVWGSSPSDVWAVGVSGVIIHYDGTSWSSVSSGTTADLAGIWGTSASDVWAVGYHTILHYDGTSWSSAMSVSEAVATVGGTSPSDVWAVSSGVFRHYDGSHWTTFSSGLTANEAPVSIWGSSASNIWVVTGTSGAPCCGRILHYNGTAWSVVPTDKQPPLDGTPNLNAIWGSSATDVWVVGTFGTILHGTPAR